MLESIFESFQYVLPAIIVGIVSYFMFKELLFRQNEQQKLQALQSKKKESLPIQLQAYERLLLFSERVDPNNLINRVQSKNNDPNGYAILLIETIKQEFEHNLVQQLYVSEESWKAVVASKEIVIQKIALLGTNSDSIEHFSKKLLHQFQGSNTATQSAIAILKSEVKKLL